MIFVTNYKTTKVLKPRKKAFHLPTFFIATKYTTILRWRFYTVVFMRSNQLNASFFSQTLIQRITVISHITSYEELIMHLALLVHQLGRGHFALLPGTVCANG